MQEVASRLGLDFSLFIDGGDSAHWQRRCEGQDGVSAGYGFVSRWPIARSELHRFDASRAMRQGRAIAMAQVDTPSGPLPVFTTHLSSAWGRSDLRQAELAQAVAFVRTEVGRDGVAVLTGDFNAPPFSDEVRRLTGLATSYEPRVALIDAWEYRRPLDPGWTWMRANELAAIHREPEARIDYIFVTPSSNGGRGEVLGVELIGARPVQGLWPSDHAGVVVALRW